jgi:hypothetical protein
VQQEVREQRTHPPPVQRNNAAVLDDRQRPENAEFDGDLAFVALLTSRRTGRG